MTWTTSCPDWQRRILAGESLITFPPLFPAENVLGMKIIKKMEVKWQKTLIITLPTKP